MVVCLANSNGEVNPWANKKVQFEEDAETEENVLAVDDIDQRFGNSRVGQNERGCTNQTSASVSVSGQERDVTDSSCDTGCDFPTGIT